MRTCMIYSNAPTIGWADDDSEKYLLATDGGPICGLDTGSRSRCCLPPEHGGECMPAAEEMLERGVRVVEIVAL